MASGDTLVGAIGATFAADTTVGNGPPGPLMTLVPQGLYVGEVPEEFSNPMVVLEHTGELPSFNTERPYIEEGDVIFHVIFPGLAQAEALAKRLKWVFDNDPDTGPAISITDVLNRAVVTEFHRTNYIITDTNQRSVANLPVYQIQIPYHSKVDKIIPART